MSTIISFGHRRRTGKDTCARFLIQHLRTSQQSKEHIVKASLAYELKFQCYKMFSWAGLKTPEHYEMIDFQKDKDNLLPRIGKSPRDIYIQFGIAVQNISEIALLEQLCGINQDCDKLVIPDLRRVGEAERIKEKGGYCIKVVNPNITGSDDLLDCALSEWNGWDNVIVNDGDLNKLYNEVIRVAQELKF